jgi:hypothetical protein
VKLGHLAVALLRRAVAESSDIEIVRRAERCLQQINETPNEALAAAAARVLAQRKPPEAAAVLLAYLPFADDDRVIDEVRSGLGALGLRGGKPEPVLVGGLRDPNPLKRGAAAEALIRAGASDARSAASKLLADSVPAVRLRVALALVESKDRVGVPVLIDLLAELPPGHGWQAEELLFRLAGEDSPHVPLGDDPAGRKRCRDAWGAWWRDHGDRVDLAKLDLAQRLLGHTLVVQMDNAGLNGRVQEVGLDGKPRWQITGLLYPVDAQVLPGNRVLIAEYRGSRVTERDFQGTIHWQAQVSRPIDCQRLPNGHTFISSRNQLLVVDRDGKPVLTHNRPRYDIAAARRLRDGKMVLLTTTRTCVLLDATGRELKSFGIGNVQLYCGFEVLPNQHVLVPQLTDNRVVEYDADGKPVWEAKTPFPTSAMRLPNGNTLIASANVQKVVEVDRDGKEVWSYRVEGRPWRARRR